jgi:hypothetical protein
MKPQLILRIEQEHMMGEGNSFAAKRALDDYSVESISSYVEQDLG